MRLTCKQRKDSDPNWKQKVQCEPMERTNYNVTECFLGNPSVVKFNDNLITGWNGLNLSYSCSI